MQQLAAQRVSPLSPLDSVFQTVDFGTDSLRTWFDWVIAHVSYEVSEQSTRLHPDSLRLYVDYAIRHGSGACHHYSSLFVAGAQKMGYQATVVTGLANAKPGAMLTAEDRHSWCAVRTPAGWYLYDPTWAAGYVDEHLRYHPKPNYRWYKRSPLQFSNRHLAFNPVWSASSLARPQADSLIAAFANLTEVEQLDFIIKGLSAYHTETATRQELDRLNILRNSLDLDLANFHLNHAIQLHNDFEQARRQFFRKPKWSPDSIIHHVAHMRTAFDTSLALFQGAALLTPGLAAYQQQSIAYALEIEPYILADEDLIARYRKARRPFRFLVLIP